MKRERHWKAGLITLMGASVLGLVGEAQAAPSAKEAWVQQIRAEYQRIQADASASRYRVVTDQEAEWVQSSEGSELTLYCEGASLRKIKLGVGGESGGSDEEFFFANGQLLFSFAAISYYNKPMYLPGARVARKDEHRRYYRGGQLFRYVGPNKKVNDNPGTAQQEDLADLLSFVAGRPCAD